MSVQSAEHIREYIQALKDGRVGRKAVDFGKQAEPRTPRKKFKKKFKNKR